MSKMEYLLLKPYLQHCEKSVGEMQKSGVICIQFDLTLRFAPNETLLLNTRIS